MNRYLVERLRPFGTTIFAEMSALAVADRLDQSRAGLSRHRRARRREAGRDRRDPRRAQPVPAGHRCPGAAARDPARTSSGSTDSTSTPTPRCWSRRARPRRSRRRCSRCASRATRSSRSSRTTTRTPRASRWRARTRRVVTLRPPDYAFDPAELRGRDHAPHEADPAQLAAQPDRQGVHARASSQLVAELAQSSTTCSS